MTDFENGTRIYVRLQIHKPKMFYSVGHEWIFCSFNISGRKFSPRMKLSERSSNRETSIHKKIWVRTSDIRFTTALLEKQYIFSIWCAVIQADILVKWLWFKNENSSSIHSFRVSHISMLLIFCAKFGVKVEFSVESVTPLTKLWSSMYSWKR